MVAPGYLSRYKEDELKDARTEALAYSIQYVFIYQGRWIDNLVM